MNERSPYTPQGALRYHFAAGFVEPGDVVVDAACGLGYGKDILGPCKWVGVDRHDEAPVVADLQEWIPGFDFDVFVGLETLEHLDRVEAYVRAARRARRWMVISTPIVPTTHYNRWHVRDHDAEQVTRMFEDSTWQRFGLLHQFDAAGFEYGLFAFRRR